MGTWPRDQRPYCQEVATLGIPACTKVQPPATARLAKKQRYGSFGEKTDFYLANVQR